MMPRWVPLPERSICGAIVFGGAAIGSSGSEVLVPLIAKYMGWRWTMWLPGGMNDYCQQYCLSAVSNAPLKLSGFAGYSCGSSLATAIRVI
jgi:hypothetical protein